MTKKTSLTAFIIVLVVLILLVMQYWTIDGYSVQADQPIRFGLSHAPVNLNPLQATDAVSARINRLIYQRLVEFAADNMPVPGISRWQQLSPGHYRFTIIKDAQGNYPRFHHGKLLTSADIKASYDAVLDIKRASPHRNAIKHIDRMEIIDEHSIDFYLSRPDPLFPAFLVIGIVPEDLLNSVHPFNTHPVGSGPFKFSHWPFAGQLFLRRQSDAQLFEFLKVKNPTVRVLKLLRGELDLIQNNLPPEHVSFLKKHQEINHLTHSGSNYSYLGFNLIDPVTANIALRKAIAYALDRDKIIRYALGNAAQKASGFFPQQHWAGAAVKTYEYNTQAAREIMQQLGYNKNNHLLLSYKTSSDPFRIRIATIIQSQLKDIYIDLHIHSYDWGTFYGDIKAGHFQLYSLTWVGINTPDIFRYVFHSHSLPPSGANRGRFNNSDIDLLIEQAEQQQTLPEQAEKYHQLQRKLQVLLPYVSLWYEDNIAFFRTDINNYRLSTDGSYDALEYVQRQLQAK